jgi:hypothetical protein
MARTTVITQTQRDIVEMFSIDVRIAAVRITLGRPSIRNVTSLRGSLGVIIAPLSSLREGSGAVYDGNTLLGIVIPTGALHSRREWKAEWRDLLFSRTLPSAWKL